MHLRRALLLRFAPLVLGILSVVAAITVPTRSLAQTAEAKASARAAATQGNDEFGKQHWAASLDLFTRAESLMHAPTHVLMIGRCNEKLGHLVRAYEAFSSLAHESIAADAPGAFKEAQADAIREQQTLEPRIPHLTVKASDPSAKNLLITMDGEPVPAAMVGIARPVDPGTHVLKAEADKASSQPKSVQIAEGSQASVVLDLKFDPNAKGGSGPDVPGSSSSGKPMRVAGFVMLGVGVAGLAVGGAFTGLGYAKRGQANDAYKKCGPPCVNGSPQATNVQSLDSSANTMQTVGLVGFVAGGALAVTGVVLVVAAPKGRQQGSAAIEVGPSSIRATGTF